MCWAAPSLCAAVTADPVQSLPHLQLKCSGVSPPPAPGRHRPLPVCDEPPALGTSCEWNRTGSVLCDWLISLGLVLEKPRQGPPMSQQVSERPSFLGVKRPRRGADHTWFIRSAVGTRPVWPSFPQDACRASVHVLVGHVRTFSGETPVPGLCSCSHPVSFGGAVGVRVYSGHRSLVGCAICRNFLPFFPRLPLFPLPPHCSGCLLPGADSAADAPTFLIPMPSASCTPVAACAFGARSEPLPGVC